VWLALALALALAAGTAQAKPGAAGQRRAAASSSKKKSAKKKPRATRRRLPAGYQAHVRRWHERKSADRAPLDESGRPKLVLEAINVKERLELSAQSDDGSFDEKYQALASLLLRDSRHDETGVVAPELLDLLYRIQRHFDAPSIRVVSAYRSASGGRHSQHSRGHAADIVVPGVSDRQLAAYVRSLAGTGVGLYPVSGFVHVDVRARSHYWIDTSGPGQRARRVVPRKRSARAAKK
jgi:uncharacterized protein YcbK (DUF882 family)